VFQSTPNKPPVPKGLPPLQDSNAKKQANSSQSSSGISLIEFLKRSVSLEIANERAKNELALLYDFTFEEGFKILDIVGKQEILAEDLLHAL
jgi:hypothetical protein